MIRRHSPPSAVLLPERLPGRVLAAPSWVMPGTLAENCAFLATKVDEIGLLFMESAACLAYDQRDLPCFPAEPPLSCHMHLPVDLPMDTPARAAAICAELLDKTSGLPVGDHWRERAGDPLFSEWTESYRQAEKERPAMRAVLHPPAHDPADTGLAGRRLAAFAQTWLSLGKSPSRLLLENVRDNDLTELAGPIREYGFGLCLDMGHLLAYGQEDLLRRQDLLERAAMLHANAPGRGRRAGEHLPLTALDADGRRQAARICGSIPDDAVVMLELFSWPHIEESLPLLRSWL